MTSRNMKARGKQKLKEKIVCVFREKQNDQFERIQVKSFGTEHISFK